MEKKNGIFLEDILYEDKKEKPLVITSVALDLLNLTNDILKEKLKNNELDENTKKFIEKLLIYKKDGLSGVIFDLEATCRATCFPISF